MGFRRCPLEASGFPAQPPMSFSSADSARQFIEIEFMSRAQGRLFEIFPTVLRTVSMDMRRGRGP